MYVPKKTVQKNEFAENKILYNNNYFIDNIKPPEEPVICEYTNHRFE